MYCCTAESCTEGGEHEKASRGPPGRRRVRARGAARSAARRRRIAPGPQAQSDRLRPRRSRLGCSVRVAEDALRDQRVSGPPRHGARVRLVVLAEHDGGRARQARRADRGAGAAHRPRAGRRPRSFARHDRDARVPRNPGACRERCPLCQHRRAHGCGASGRCADARDLGRARSARAADRRRDERHAAESDARRGGDLRGVVRCRLRVLHRPRAVHDRCPAVLPPVRVRLRPRGDLPAERRRRRCDARGVEGRRPLRQADVEATGGHARARGRRLMGPGRALARAPLRVRARARGRPHAPLLLRAVLAGATTSYACSPRYPALATTRRPCREATETLS